MLTCFSCFSCLLHSPHSVYYIHHPLLSMYLFFTFCLLLSHNFDLLVILAVTIFFTLYFPINLPWFSLTSVCVCVCVCACACVRAQLLQWYPTLCDLMDSCPPGSSVVGFFRQEYWSGPMPSSRGSSQPGD